jgi:hypothetical protein
VKGICTSLALALLAAGCATSTQRAPLETVARVDVDRYAGTWHEVALYPNRFQQACASDTTATYAPLGEGRIGVRNRCLRADGTEMAVDGVAEVVDPTTRAKLKVELPAGVAALDRHRPRRLLGAVSVARLSGGDRRRTEPRVPVDPRSHTDASGRRIPGADAEGAFGRVRPRSTAARFAALKPPTPLAASEAACSARRLRPAGRSRCDWSGWPGTRPASTR